MRALTGSIITAGALIGLGLVAMGFGTRYQNLPFKDVDLLKFSQMDRPLVVILSVLLASVFVGLGITFFGLAYHHERRHRERLRELGGTTAGETSRIP